MVGKKGYMKTLEAIISVLIVLMVVAISLTFDNPDTNEVPSEIEAIQDSIFDKLQNENRDYLFTQQENIPTLLVDEIDELRFEYAYMIICDDVDCNSDVLYPVEIVLPQENIYVDSFIAQEYGAEFEFKLFRLYIWYKEL